MTSQTKQPPKAVGLYDPRFEHDACGVGMVARLDNVPSHEVIAQAIQALENLEHRGASGADPTTGDGAGILMQMPDELLRAVVDFELPPSGRYGVLMCFFPPEDAECARLRELLERTTRAEGQRVLGWREVPVDTTCTGRTAGACRPAIWQLFVGLGAEVESPADFDQDAFERKLFVIRRVCELVRRRRSVRDLELLAHDQLQGHADLQPARRLLSRPARPARQERDGAGALTLLHQHLPKLGARAPLPRDLPQRRDQHRDGQRQLDACARVGAAERAVRGGPPQDPADRQGRRLGLRDLRPRARAADARRPLAAALGDDDDPRGLPRTRGPAAGAEGLLRVPLLPDGAVGRAGVGGVHRRARDRRHARPQRPAAGALGGDRRRPRRAGLGDRLARHPGRAHQAPRASAARQAVPRRPRAGLHRRGWRGQARDLHAPALRRVVRAQLGALRRPPSVGGGDDLRPAAARPPACFRLHPGGPARAAHPDGARRRRAGRLDGQRPRARGALRPGAAAVLLLQAAVRASHQPADRPDPRGDRDEPRDLTWH